jgi:hypothetical protein
MLLHIPRANSHAQSAGDPMPFKKITEYNEHADSCSLQSELTGDADNKLHWLAMAEGWRLLAESLVKKDHRHMSLT